MQYVNWFLADSYNNPVWHNLDATGEYLIGWCIFHLYTLYLELRHTLETASYLIVLWIAQLLARFVQPQLAPVEF
ncbi:MAG: hypothetical protein H0X63_01850 [Flavobacteriales bacterium]|nr:hypothetical protein [Flavobacteriales bacterium]